MNRRWHILTWTAILLAIAGVSTTLAEKKGPATAVETDDNLITLQSADGEIGDILRLIAEQAGLSISIGQGVEGRISVHFADVPARSATDDGSRRYRQCAHAIIRFECRSGR